MWQCSKKTQVKKINAPMEQKCVNIKRAGISTFAFIPGEGHKSGSDSIIIARKNASKMPTESPEPILTRFQYLQKMQSTKTHK